MKKLLVLVSLVSLASFFACGESGNQNTGEKAANVETATGMSAAILGDISQMIALPTSSVGVNSTETIDCMPAGTATAVTTEIDANSGTTIITLDACGAVVCDGHVFMDGTFTSSYNDTDTTATVHVTGTVAFVDQPAGWDVVTYFVGKTCSVDMTANLVLAELDALTTDAEIQAYIEAHTAGYLCGYNWTEITAAIDADTYCTIIDQ
jgi:hypothetical protein